MSRSRVFLFILLVFIGGVFVRSFFEINQNYCFLVLIFSLITLFVSYKNKFAVLVSFVILAFIFGIWLTDREIEKTKNLIYAGKNFQEKAEVIKVSPSSFGQNIIAQLENEKISILIQTPQYPEYAYGDLLKISCVAKPIENKDDSFDYRMYMAKEGVLYRCDKAKVYPVKSDEVGAAQFNGVKKVGENFGSLLYGKIISTRASFEEKITKVIPMPEGALAGGLLFGGSGGLSKEVQDDFSRTGMTHIVAVSGYNVTIIGEYLILLGIVLGLWRGQAIWFAIFGIILFVVMAGLPSSAVRAGVMSGVLFWAMRNGRLASSENAILFAGAVMLFINPLLMRWDIGFQLSFLATLGIVATSSFWEKSFVKKHKAMGISEVIVLSLSAQIFVLPIIAYNFQIVSLISLLANVFVLPIVPFSMLLVFLVTFSGFIFVPLSVVFAWLAFVLLAYEIKLIHVLAQLPWASVEVEKVHEWWIAAYYCILVTVIYFLKKRACETVEN